MRLVPALFLAAAWLLIAPPATAQIITTEDDYQSPQRYYIEIKFGPYSPSRIDDQLASGTVVDHIFGGGTDLMIKGELDLQLFQSFGTLAIGGVFGWYNTSAAAFIDDSPDGTTPSTSAERSGSETSITLLPMSLLAVYRFDWPAVKWGVPLVPFVKFGLNYTIWWGSIDDRTPSVDGDEAKGGTFGWQFNVGGALLLDVLEPSAAKTLDVELGINHTYLFFEMVHVGSVGDSRLDVGDTTWDAGIAFEF
jgi:hypothetical protein